MRPIDEKILRLAGGSTSGLGTGGMRSKLEAAKIVTTAGESVWIVNGRAPDVLRRVIRGERLGTLFPASGRSMPSLKRWIGYTARPRGSYSVDTGAKEALCREGRSLLPVGVVDVQGDFAAGDVVTLVGPTGEGFARGLTNYS